MADVFQRKMVQCPDDSAPERAQRPEKTAPKNLCKSLPLLRICLFVLLCHLLVLAFSSLELRYLYHGVTKKPTIVVGVFCQA